MEAKPIDPRIAAAKQWRQNEEKISKRQSRFIYIMLVVGSGIITTCIIIVKLIKNGQSTFYTNILVAIAILGLAITILSIQLSSSKRRNARLRAFYDRLDQMPRTE